MAKYNLSIVDDGLGIEIKRTLVTQVARRCWMWGRPPDALVGLGIPCIEEDVHD